MSNYSVALYIEYLARFGVQTIDNELKTKVTSYIDCDSKKDIFIKDLLNVAKNRYQTGMSLSELSPLIEEAFEYFGLNERADYNEYQFFFNGFIDSSLLNLTILSNKPKENVIQDVRNLISEFSLLSNSYQKVNIGLSILRFVLSASLIGELSSEILTISDYLNTYDLTDMEIQNILHNTFTLFL